MVGVTIECRLGNQLFQYAFIKALSEELHTSFFLNERFERFIAADYFDVKGYNPLKNPIQRLYFKLSSGNIFKNLQNTEIDSDYQLALNVLEDNKIYRGYFQSELFFKSIADKIANYIHIKNKFKQRFQAMYQQLFAEYYVIAVHIRRGDYLNLNEWWVEKFGSSDLSLPVGYYLKCLKEIPKKDKYKIIFVSDDMDFVRTAFSDVENALFANNDMITDFQIIMNADACIISNSSFAWWAAYLNSKKDKKIYCPEHWLGFKIKREYPENIIPGEWIKVNVTQG